MVILIDQRFIWEALPKQQKSCIKMNLMNGIRMTNEYEHPKKKRVGC